MKKLVLILALTAFGLATVIPQTAMAGHLSVQTEQAKHHKKHKKHKKGKKGKKHHKKGHRKHKKHHSK